MKTGGTSTFILLQWIYITLLSVIMAQEVKVWPEVTGYLGHDVTLHCEFIQGPEAANITQFQWALLQPNGKESVIIVKSKQYGETILKPYVKEKVEFEGLSLIIKDVNMTDAGLYRCSVSAFPSGSFDGTTKLIVKEQMSLSVGVVTAIVLIVMLMLVIIAATAYLIIKRCDSSVNLVQIDTNGPVTYAAQPSVIKTEQDVLYSEVKPKPSRGETASSRSKHSKTEEVTYAEVRFLRQQQ